MLLTQIPRYIEEKIKNFTQNISLDYKINCISECHQCPFPYICALFLHSARDFSTSELRKTHIVTYELDLIKAHRTCKF